MSETTPEPLKPDTEEETAELRRQLERTATIVNLRNQEIAALNSRLAGKDETISEASEQIERLESELASEKKKSAATGKDLPGAGDVLNQLLGKLPKSKATMKDATAILEILEGA